MIFTKNRGLGGAGYLLAGHPQAELTMKQVNNLFDLSMMIDKGVIASGLQIQRFKTVIPAAGTDDVTFTDTVQACSVLGGYVEVYDADADFEIDIGHEGDTDGFVDDLNAGAVEDAIVPVITDYLGAEDVVCTITSNSNTVAITVYITLLTVKLVTS